MDFDKSNIRQKTDKDRLNKDIECADEAFYYTNEYCCMELLATEVKYSPSQLDTRESMSRYKYRQRCDQAPPRDVSQRMNESKVKFMPK